MKATVPRAGLDGRAHRGADVETAVELGGLGPGREPPAELRVHRTPDGPARGQRGQDLARARHQPLELAKALALLQHHLREPLQLVPRGELRGQARRGARRGERGAADAAVAPAGGDLGPERVPDARLEVAPAPDLAAP